MKGNKVYIDLVRLFMCGCAYLTSLSVLTYLLHLNYVLLCLSVKSEAADRL
jgi:hypothetical protein